MMFYKFLDKIRPFINAKRLESAAGIPRNTIGKHYRWADGKPNGHPCYRLHFPAIVRALCGAFGCVEIGGWRITCETDGPAIFATRPIPEREADVLEPTSGRFEYLQPELRQLYDDFDFANLFCG
jgi:hypothetical protein